jgi:hypothetical protein
LTDGDAGADRLSEPHVENRVVRSSAEQGSESHPPLGQEYKVLRRLSPPGGPESTGNRTVGTRDIVLRDRGDSAQRVSGFLVAMAIPLICAICSGPIANVFGYRIKRSKPAWRQGILIRARD